jgi:hypothetical protein
MKYNCHKFSFLIIFSVVCLFTGCIPYKDITINNDESLHKLNDLIKDKSIEIRTKENCYYGNHVIVNRQSTLVEDISTRHKTIPSASLKDIVYGSDNVSVNGNIILNNKQVIKARNIVISPNDSIITFDEVVTKLEILPTKDLTSIYRMDTPNYLGLYGLLGGVVVGAVLGTFIGHPIESEDSPFGVSRFEIWAVSTCVGGISGIFVAFTTRMFDEWWNINLTYKFDDNSL